MTTTRHWVLGALLLASTGLFALPSSAQQVTVGISGTGAVRFTDASALVCDATTEGSIRYEDASNRVEFCDDTVWTVLGPGGVGTIYVTDLADAVTDYVTDHNMRIGSNTAMTAGAANNIFIGESAGTAGTSNAADNNVAIGYQALDALTTGAGNIAIGKEAMTRSTSGIENIAIGRLALENNTIGGGNIAIGTNALGTNSDGGGSIGIGYGALSSLTADGYWNTALGYQAGDGITTGDSNIVIGYNVDPPSNTANSQLTIGNLIFATGGFGTGTTVGTGNVGIGIPAPGVRLSVGNGATSAGVIGIYEDTDNGANYASFTVPALAANTVYTLPADDGDAGEQLQTDGSGTLTWESAGGGGSIDGLSDATYDTGADHNMRLGSNTAMTAGAAENLFIGESAGTAGTTNAADRNIAVGYQALDALTTGADNIAIGKSALSANDTGNGSVAIGTDALAIFTYDSSYSVAVGYRAFAGANGNNTQGVAVGGGALTNAWDQDHVAVGYMALNRTGNSSFNTALGNFALEVGTNGSNNTAVGQSSLNLTQGSSNTAIGYASGDNITSGASNIVIGASIDAMSATGNSQLNIGDTIYGDLANDRIRIGGSGVVSSGPFLVEPPATETIAAAGTITANACGTIKAIQSTGSVTTNTTNTFTAPAAGNSGCCMVVTNVDTADTITLDVNANFITGAGTDIAVGPGDGVQVCSNGTTWYQGNALSSLASSGSSIDGLSDATYDTGADHNMRLGSNTAMTAGAAGNLFIGESAGSAGTSNAADNNLAIGYTALDSLTTGNQNTAIGRNALTAVTTAALNVAIGYNALAANTGDSNVAIGPTALDSNVGGYENIGIGDEALTANTNGYSNVAIGYRANYASGGSGYQNVVIGTNAARNLGGNGSVAIGYAAMVSGSSNDAVAIGRNALDNATGNNNIAIGYQAGNLLTSGASNIIIGYDADAPANNTSSFLNIGDSIYGDLATDRIRIGGSGTVAAGPLYAVPPATETIAGAAAITANACGTIKPIQSTGSVTTNTTNTFTGSTVAGCCMDVINVDAADTITLDANGAFKTIGGADQALGPDDTVRVCSNGTNWYQMGAVSGNQ